MQRPPLLCKATDTVPSVDAAKSRLALLWTNQRHETPRLDHKGLEGSSGQQERVIVAKIRKGKVLFGRRWQALQARQQIELLYCDRAKFPLSILTSAKLPSSTTPSVQTTAFLIGLGDLHPGTSKIPVRQHGESAARHGNLSKRVDCPYIPLSRTILSSCSISFHCERWKCAHIQIIVDQQLRVSSILCTTTP